MRFTQAEIDVAKNANIVEVIGSRYSLIKKGTFYYLAEHNSLCIFPKQNNWFWFSQNTGGDLIGFFMKYEGLSFTDSVGTILSKVPSISPVTEMTKVTKKEKTFSPPPPSKNNKRVIAYLCQTRGIDYQLVLYLIRSEQLYEVAGSHNAAFIGYDDKGNAAHVYLRGTTSSRWTGDSAGSNKKYCFKLIGNKKDIVHIFESPIDLLSFLTIEKHNHRPTEDTYLSLCSTSTSSIEHYIEKNKVTTIYVRTDNDTAGRRIGVKLKKLYPDIEIIPAYPKNCKDYNDLLLNLSCNTTEVKRKEKK